jgi:hypothetical protein
MPDPLSRKLAAAPLDNEPFTMEDRRAVAEADEWSASNEPIALENVLADLGLTVSDLESMSGAPLHPENPELDEGEPLAADEQ